MGYEIKELKLQDLDTLINKPELFIQFLINRQNYVF